MTLVDVQASMLRNCYQPILQILIGLPGIKNDPLFLFPSKSIFTLCSQFFLCKETRQAVL
jgi:hypothetical protein